MFLEETRYLEWANAQFPRATHDLAASGEPTRNVVVLEEARAATLADLAHAVARHNARPVEEVSLALGASHGLFLAYAALLNPGAREEVLVESPHYEPLSRIPHSLGAQVIHFERSFAENYAVDVDRVLSLVTERTRIVALSNLHNPSGVRVPDTTLRAISDALRGRAPQCVLLVDEAYASFDDRCDDRGIFMHSARNCGDNVVAVSTLTKSFGYGPERIGWVLAAPDLTRKVTMQITTSLGVLPRSMATLGVSVFSRLAHLRSELVPDLATRRTLCHDWVAAHPQLHWVPPTEGLFGLVHVQNATNLLPTFERGLEEQGVLVSPGVFFGVPGAFRLSWARPLEHVARALSKLQSVLSLRVP